MQGGAFLTLPQEDLFRNSEYNPRGLFNFSFEQGGDNNQNYTENHPAMISPLAGFKTMLENLNAKIYFQIQNGDWLYEEVRETPLEKWMQDNNVVESDIPRTVQIARQLWESGRTINYISHEVRILRRGIITSQPFLCMTTMRYLTTFMGLVIQAMLIGGQSFVILASRHGMIISHGAILLFTQILKKSGLVRQM